MPISELVAVVAQLRCRSDGVETGSGTGFFYLQDDALFLVTNRHVVVDEEDDYAPEELVLRLHTDPEDLRKNDRLVVDLYERDRPLWREHPTEGRNVDVIAVELDKDGVQGRFFIRALDRSNHIPDEIDIGIGDDVQVIGYPLGFYDQVHNLPIIRSATLASVYPVPFEEKPYVLVDSRLHSGTSGSPVMTKPTNMARTKEGAARLYSGVVQFFVGVHSATIDIVDRDPEKDEPLGLNVVWFADLIPEIIG